MNYIQKNLDKIKKTHIDIQSFLLLLNDKKPVIRLSIFEEYKKDLVELCSSFGLIVLNKSISQLYGEKFDKPLIFSYISKSDDCAEIAYRAEMNNDRSLFGEMLGYPKCCVKKLHKNLIKEKDYTISLADDTKDGKYYFQCNNIFNFDSKLGFDDTLEVYQKNFAVFNKVEKNFLIRHVPCSYSCEKSKSIGNSTLRLLELEFPQLAKEIVSVIKKPILYFDYFNWIVFEGSAVSDEIRYSKVLAIKSLVSTKMINEIKKGDKIKLLPNMIIVYNENRMIKKIKKEKNSMVLNFK